MLFVGTSRLAHKAFFNMGSSFFSTAVKYTVQNVAQLMKGPVSPEQQEVTMQMQVKGSNGEMLFSQDQWKAGPFFYPDIRGLHESFMIEMYKVQEEFPTDAVTGKVDDGFQVMEYKVVPVVGEVSDIIE